MVSQLEKQLSIQKSAGSKVSSAKLVNGVLFRKSLLFDSREILSITKEMAFSVGKNGLSQLSAIDPVFEQFAETIFSESSKNFLYYTQDNESRTKIKHQVDNFLMLLSPYMMIKAAMYTLEWLIYQYHMDELCWRCLLHSILPFHDSKLFPRIVQLIDLDSMEYGDKRLYSFLKSVQKEAVPLPKRSLISHVNRNPGLLVATSNHINNVTQLLLSSTNIYTTNGSGRWEAFSVLYSFYASLAYASINNSIVNTQSNAHIRNQLLYNVIDGLTSEVEHVRSTNVIIISKIIEHTELTGKQLDFIIKKILTFYGMDVINLHLLVQFCRTHPQYSFTSKLCKLLVETDSLVGIHRLLSEKDTTNIGKVIVRSIDNFLHLTDNTVVDRLAKLFFGWRHDEQLIAELVDHLIIRRINTECENSKKLLIELENFLPSLVVDCVGKKLVEFRDQKQDTDHYQNLYKLLSACLIGGESSMCVHHVDGVDLPLLLCVYNSNSEIRKSAVLGLRDFINQQKHPLSQPTQLKLKELLEFLIYNNSCDIVLLVLSEIQPLPSFSQLFNSIERVHIFKYIMECLLNSPEEWIDAVINVNVPEKSIATNYALDWPNTGVNHALTLDLLTVMIMILHRYSATSSNSQYFLKIIHFASCLLPTSVVEIFKKQLNVNNASNNAFLFMKNVFNIYAHKFKDFVNYVTSNFTEFKTLSKYTALCAISQLDTVDVSLDYDGFLSKLVDELQPFQYIQESLLTQFISIQSWNNVFSMMDVNHYPIALIYMMQEQFLKGRAIVSNHVINCKSSFVSYRKLLYWLCESYHCQDRKMSSLLHREWFSMFFLNRTIFADVGERVLFVQLCLYSDYNILSAGLFMDLFEMIWRMSLSDILAEKYLPAGLILAAQHKKENVRKFAFSLPLLCSTSTNFLKFFNYIVVQKDEIINFPQKICDHVLHVCNNSKNIGIATYIIHSLFNLILVNTNILKMTTHSTLTLLLFIEKLPIEKCILNKKENVNLLVQLVDVFTSNAKYEISPTNAAPMMSSQDNSTVICHVNDNIEVVGCCLETVAHMIMKLFLELHKEHNSSMANMFEELILKWSLLSSHVSSRLIDNLDEKFFLGLPTSTINNLATKWLDSILKTKKENEISHSEHNELLLKLLRRCPINFQFIENYIGWKDVAGCCLDKLEVFLELLQSNNCIVNQQLLLVVFFECVDSFYLDKKFYQLQMLLNCCESILCHLIEAPLKSDQCSVSPVTSVDCLLPLLNSNNHIDGENQQPCFKLSIFNIFKYLSMILPPAVILPHLVTIFISIGNDDYDNSYTMDTIQQIIKHVFPSIINQSRNNQLIDSSIEEVVVAIVDAFPHIPHHRRLTLCTTLFKEIDVYDKSQKYSSIFIELVLRTDPLQVETFCIDFFYSRLIEQQIQILLQLFDHITDISLNNIKKARETKSPSKRKLHNSGLLKVQFDTLEECVQHQIVVLSMVGRITQDSENVLYLNCSSLEHSSFSVKKESSIYLLFEAIFNYSFHINKLSARCDESRELKKLLRFTVRQCNSCINNLLNSMPLTSKLGCMMHSLSSSSCHVRQSIMDHVIEVISKSASFIAKSENNVNIIMDMVEKLVTTTEKLIAEMHVPKSDIIESRVEELQMLMCCIKCIVFHIFTKNSFRVPNINRCMEFLGEIFDRLFSLYELQSIIPINAFVTVNLTVCELASLLSVNVLSHVFPLLTVLVDLFSNQCTYKRAQEDIQLSLLWFEANVTSVNKLFSSVGNFFTSQLYSLICSVLLSGSSLFTECVQSDSGSSADIVLELTHKLIVDNISKNTDSRVYLPIAERIIKDFLPSMAHSAKFFAVSIKLIIPTFIQHATHNTQLLTSIYLSLFDCVVTACSSRFELLTQIIECSALSFCEFILLHSETQSNEIISIFYKWTTSTIADMSSYLSDIMSSRCFTFFYVVDLLWSKLKSIMLLFAPIYFQFTVDFVNCIVNNKESVNSLTNFMSTFYVVQSFNKCFDVDKTGFINHERMTAIVKPLIGLIVCASVIAENFHSLCIATSFVETTLAPAIASLTTCTKENKLFFSIQSEIILILRTYSSNEQIVCYTLIVLENLYGAIGDIASSLLPELSPVLMEIMDEESARVQLQIKKLVQSIENITGESLDRFL